ncbi:MAG TPA: hypothetical protein VF633_00115 [Brevundimonas sp.]
MLIQDLNRRIAEAAEGPLDGMERTAKAVGVIVKAVQSVIELGGGDETGNLDEGLDAEAEQHLRDQFLGRLDAIAAALELEGVRRCPACGRFEPDRAGLEKLARSGAEGAEG